MKVEQFIEDTEQEIPEWNAVWQLDKQSNNILSVKQQCSKELRVSLVRLEDVNNHCDVNQREASNEAYDKMNTELTNPDNKSVTTSKHNIDLKNTQITMAHRDSHPNNITGPFDLNKHNTIHPDVKLNSCNINVTQPNQSGGSEEHNAIDADGLTHSSNVSERTSIQPNFVHTQS
ncbi:unnamed protein product [Leptidea sinapis]|uniref:Uncharacterized protein n=1 Tax=Leptidea sinapis TaxID=189913 RepID=A0A5E4Q995_9NEOP|nr:unnamed protein product [Leptidea sinapis]